MAYVVVGIPTCSSLPPYLKIQGCPLDVVVMLWLRRLLGSRFVDGFSQRKSLKLNQYKQHVMTGYAWLILSEKKVGFGGSLISTPPVLVRSGPWSSISGLPVDKIFEIDQLARLVWLFLSIEKELAVCTSHLLLGSAGRHGILVPI